MLTFFPEQAEMGFHYFQIQLHNHSQGYLFLFHFILAQEKKQCLRAAYLVTLPVFPGTSLKNLNQELTDPFHHSTVNRTI